MQTIDLKRIIKVANVKTSFIAGHLFPANSNPSQALRRVMRGGSFLDSWQIAKLSELLNVPIGLLFEDADWHMSVEANRVNIIQFRTYGYYAELDTSTMTTTVSGNGVVFFEKVVHQKSVGLTDYLGQLTDLIIRINN